MRVMSNACRMLVICSVAPEIVAADTAAIDELTHSNFCYPKKCCNRNASGRSSRVPCQHNSCAKTLRLTQPGSDNNVAASLAHHRYHSRHTNPPAVSVNEPNRPTISSVAGSSFSTGFFVVEGWPFLFFCGCMDFPKNPALSKS